MAEGDELVVGEALALLEVVEGYDAGGGPGRCVHTFVQGGFALVGAHWYLAEVEAAFRRWGARESGAMAAGLGHGVCVVEGDRTVFFQTRTGAPVPRVEAGSGSGTGAPAPGVEAGLKRRVEVLRAVAGEHLPGAGPVLASAAALVCDGCGASVAVDAVSGAGDVAGWVRRDGDDFCPGCAGA